MSDRYRVVFEGGLRPGVRTEDAAAYLRQTFGMSDAEARALVDKGRRVMVKRDLRRDEAEHYRAALDEAGMITTLEPMDPAGNGVTLDPRSGAAEAPDRMSSGQDAARPAGGVASGAIPEAAALPAGRGAGWIGDGFRYFARSPGGWLLAALLYAILSIVAQFVPILGSVAVIILWPVFIAGFMLGAREQDRGGSFRVEHLFAGFSPHGGQLALVGLIYLIASLLVTVLAVLGAGAALAPMIGGMGTEMMRVPEPEALFAPSVLLGVLFGALFTIPLMMMVLLAPALVAVDGLPAWPAMKGSFSACLRNLLPFLVYGLLALPLLLVAMVPFGLGLLVVGPALTAGLYAAWKEIFHGGDGRQQAVAPL